jgi:hypothetical protein
MKRFSSYFIFPTSHTTVRTGLVYGGSLNYDFHRFIVLQQENIAGLA